MKRFLKKYDKKSALLFLIFFALPSLAQETEKSTVPEFPSYLRDPANYLITFLLLIIILTIYTLTYALKIILRAKSEVGKSESKESSKPVTEKIKKPGFWKQFDRKILTKAVPVEKEEDVLMHHNYDGIRELDNSLPPWWKWGFIITIIFAGIYLFGYHVTGTGKLQLEEYADEIADADKTREERLKTEADNITENNVTAFSDEAELLAGKETFTKLCATCHLADGGGQVGPNLTDDYWIHGGGIKNIFKTIINGVPEKGMISWKSQLSSKQIQQVSSYILTLHGTKPAAPKEPQGELWIEKEISNVDSTSQTQNEDQTVTK